MELIQFRYSPYNEKVRWALDFKRVPHTRRSLLNEYAAIDDALDCAPPRFSDWIARALAYTRTLPPEKAKAKPKPEASTGR